MKKYEIIWKPNLSNFSIQVDVVDANSIAEATKYVEGKAKMLGATSINWLSKKEIR